MCICQVDAIFKASFASHLRVSRRPSFFNSVGRFGVLIVQILAPPRLLPPILITMLRGRAYINPTLPFFPFPSSFLHTINNPHSCYHPHTLDIHSQDRNNRQNAELLQEHCRCAPYSPARYGRPQWQDRHGGWRSSRRGESTLLLLLVQTIFISSKMACKLRSGRKLALVKLTYRDTKLSATSPSSALASSCSTTSLTSSPLPSTRSAPSPASRTPRSKLSCAISACSRTSSRYARSRQRSLTVLTL